MTSSRTDQNADARPPQWTSNKQPVVSIDCPSVPLGGTSCVLGNLVINSAQQGVGDHPAVRVIRGQVHGVTLDNPGFDGALDVRDGNDIPAGEYVSRSMGGYTLVGSTSRKAATVSSLLRNP